MLNKYVAGLCYGNSFIFFYRTISVSFHVADVFQLVLHFRKQHVLHFKFFYFLKIFLYYFINFFLLLLQL